MTQVPAWITILEHKDVFRRQHLHRKPFPDTNTSVRFQLFKLKTTLIEFVWKQKTLNTKTSFSAFRNWSGFLSVVSMSFVSYVIVCCQPIRQKRCVYSHLLSECVKQRGCCKFDRFSADCPITFDWNNLEISERRVPYRVLNKINEGGEMFASMPERGL